MNDKLQYIEGNCFHANKSLVSITLPPTLKAIREKAFQVCVKLKHVELNNYPIDWGKDIFGACDKLIELAVGTGFHCMVVNSAGYNMGNGVPPYLHMCWDRKQKKNIILVAYVGRASEP